MRLAADRRKNYASDLIASGIARNNIYEIAFAFDGKEVLVKERHVTASDDEVLAWSDLSPTISCR